MTWKLKQNGSDGILIFPKSKILIIRDIIKEESKIKRGVWRDEEDEMRFKEEARGERRWGDKWQVRRHEAEAKDYPVRILSSLTWADCTLL